MYNRDQRRSTSQKSANTATLHCFRQQPTKRLTGAAADITSLVHILTSFSVFLCAVLLPYYYFFPLFRHNRHPHALAVNTHIYNH